MNGKFKRILSILLVLGMLLSMTACGSNSENLSNLSTFVSEVSQSESIISEVNSENPSSSNEQTVTSVITNTTTVITGPQSEISSTNSSTPTQQPNVQQNSNTDKDVITVNGVSLSKYKVVYPSDDIYAQYAAENLKTYIDLNFGVNLAIGPDNVGNQANEILLGNTNRGVAIENENYLGDTEYAIKAVGSKIVLKASGYMIGGAVRGFLNICESAKKVDGTLTANINKTIIEEYEYKTPRNALLYIGDGMGHNHIKWAIAEGMPKFYASDMPNKGEAVTYSYSVNPLNSAKYTDSAAAGTALATGYKTINGYLGLDHDNKSIKNIRELANEHFANTAVLTTDAITGATPSAFMVHINDRNKTSEIEKEINKLFSSKSINAAKGSLDDNLLMTSKETLRTISKGKNGFFMMLEEGYIDKHAHNNNKADMIHCVNRFNETIAYAMEFTLIRGDTVLIVTADHETGGITENNGAFTYTSKNHTNVNVPLFAMGKGTEIFADKATNNVSIPKFLATIYGDNNFGDTKIPK